MVGLIMILIWVILQIRKLSYKICLRFSKFSLRIVLFLKFRSQIKI